MENPVTSSLKSGRHEGRLSLAFRPCKLAPDVVRPETGESSVDCAGIEVR